jgi:probable HAF family extracellular repeat protein
MRLPAILSVLCCLSPTTFAAQYKLEGTGVLPPRTQSWAFDINDGGQVVGGDLPNGQADYAGFSYSNGTRTELSPLEVLQALAINTSGQITGSAGTSAGKAFLDTNGVIQNIDTFQNSTGSQGNAVNDSGDVVGEYYTNPYYPRAFLYTNGTLTDIGGNYQQTHAYAINNHGQVVGSYKDHTHEGPVIFVNGSPVLLDPMHGREGYAYDINDSGQIVGQIASEAFLYENGSFHLLGGLPGFTLSAALGINERGDIVGTSHDVHPVVSATLFTRGAVFNLNNMIDPHSGWMLQKAYAINAAGQIVGFGFNPAGLWEGFLLTPTSGVGPVLVPGDADGNGTIDFSDLLTLSQNYGKAGMWTQGDFTGDGKVAFDDLLGLAQNYGHTLSPTASAVPEPSATISILAASLLLSRRRR